jgi:hypothetical protein
MMEVIVTKIVAFANEGERDANRLADLVLNDLADDGLAAADGSPEVGRARAGGVVQICTDKSI